jgi:hypothetical protein
MRRRKLPSAYDTIGRRCTFSISFLSYPLACYSALHHGPSSSATCCYDKKHSLPFGPPATFTHSPQRNSRHFVWSRVQSRQVSRIATFPRIRRGTDLISPRREGVLPLPARHAGMINCQHQTSRADCCRGLARHGYAGTHRNPRRNVSTERCAFPGDLLSALTHRPIKIGIPPSPLPFTHSAS